MLHSMLLLHGRGYDGDGFGPGMFVFGPGMFWMGMLLLFLLFRLSARHTWHAQRWHSTPPVRRTPGAGPDAPATEDTANSGRVWPDLYPDNSNQPPRPPKDDRGKIEYF